MDIPAPLTRYRRDVEAFLQTFLDRPAAPPRLSRMVRYHLGWEDAEGREASNSGKALRPALCLLACEAAGGDWRRAVPSAAALEIVHNFSLVHDDIQDRDTERRHRPTVWAIWGEAQAINAGDALLVLAQLALLRLHNEGVSADTVVEAARILNGRTLEMVEGQVLDVGFEDTLDVGLDGYLRMVEKKTGALFDGALSLGVLVGGAEAEVVRAMGRCGRLLGTASQIRDDMLGVWGAECRTGKEPASDIRRRKKSVPAVYALAQAEGEALAEMRCIYSQPTVSEEDVAAVLRILDAVGAQAYCAGLAEERKRAALAEFARLHLELKAGRELEETAKFLLERDF